MTDQGPRAGTADGQPVGCPSDFDPTTGDFRRDPHSGYRHLRAACPVARTDAYGGFWAVTRRADIEAVVTDPTTFSSRYGIIVPRNPASGRRPPMHYDPPEHTAWRRALNPVFRKDRLGWVAPFVRRVARTLVDAAVQAAHIDAFSALASPLCGETLAELLGLPRELRPTLLAHSAAFEEAQFDFDGARVEHENLVLYDLCRQVVAVRRRHPRDPDRDLVSGLLGARPDGRPVDDELVAGSLRQIVVAGHGAPALALAGAVHHLAVDRELQDLLRRSPGLIPAAVEEMLRLHTPNQGFARTVQRDVELGGRLIRTGEMVAIPYTSANRDEAVYDRPDEVVLGRDGHHLAFGFGVHVCPGSHVGRVQMTVALEELLGRTDAFVADGEPAWAPFPVHGPRSLPIGVVGAGEP
jgi:cytochrome P450